MVVFWELLTIIVMVALAAVEALDLTRSLVFGASLVIGNCCNEATRRGAGTKVCVGVC